MDKIVLAFADRLLQCLLELHQQETVYLAAHCLRGRLQRAEQGRGGCCASSGRQHTSRGLQILGPPGSLPQQRVSAGFPPPGPAPPQLTLSACLYSRQSTACISTCWHMPPAHNRPLQHTLIPGPAKGPCLLCQIT